nr:B3 domain-containing protein At2g31420 [Ziziphus jujuba var. spinosa]
MNTNVSPQWWCVSNKGMLQLADGSWVVSEIDVEDYNFSVVRTDEELWYGLNLLATVSVQILESMSTKKSTSGHPKSEHHGHHKMTNEQLIMMRKMNMIEEEEDDQGPNSKPELSRGLLGRIQEMGGSDIKLVIQKKLYKSDLERDNNSLSMPWNELKSEFLSPEEKTLLNTKRENNNRHEGIEVLVIEPNQNVSQLCLEKWDSNDNSSSYVLTKTWYDVARNNNLEVDDIVQVWSFRVNSDLSFVVVNLSSQQSCTTSI